MQLRGKATDARQRRTWFVIPLIAAATLALVPWLLQAQSLPPHLFFGTAYVGGAVTAPGTEVVAFDGNRRVGATFTGEGGSFRIDVSRSHGAIAFAIGGLPAAETVSSWTSGMRTRGLVLTAVTQDPVCSVGAGRAATNSTNPAQSHELPHIFIGQATLGGAPVIQGTEITAWDGSTFLGSATSRYDGWYTIRVARAHGPISFKIGGLTADRTYSQWVSGEITGEFNITADGPAGCLVGIAPVATIVGAFGGRIETIFFFDGAAKKWLFYDPELAQFSDLTHLTPGQPYFVKVTESFRAHLNGSDRDLTCVSGNCWNILVW